MGTEQTKKMNIPYDRISKMPDEVLSFMLLLLPSEEVARTSILSRRWKNLWKTSAAYSSSLNLDIVSMRGNAYSCNMFRIFEDGDYVEKTELLSIERLKFIKWVDKILQLDYSPMMDSFRLRYYIKKDFADHIDQWIDMAISKRVKNFHIDLSHFHNFGYLLPNEEFYTFPDWLFTCKKGSLVKLLCLKSCIFRPLDFNFSSLLDLQLDQVLIDQDSFVNFLSNCPNLEKLCLVQCWKLLSLKISGSLLKLKYLAIISCISLGYIEINARNLNKLEYRGSPVNISFLNVPQLSNVIFHTSAPISHILEHLLRHLPKLDSLMLTAFLIEKPISPIQVINLKKLVLMISAFKGTLWGFIPLLCGFPYLHTLELNWCFPLDKDREEKRMQKPFNSSHCYLKNIILSGFKGTAHEVEFTSYLLNMATTLQKITVLKAMRSYCYEEGYSGIDIGDVKIDEGATKQLMNVLPPGVELMFL